MARSKTTLHLDRENRKLLGVCAGLANFLEVEARPVRLIFLGCCIFGAWFLVPLYFLAWFLLDESSAGVRTSIAENHMVNHFKTVDYKKKLYRNTEDGKLLGICAGIADYLEVNVFAVRIFFLAMVLLTGFPLLIYFGAALVLDKKPATEYFAERMQSYAAESGADFARGKNERTGSMGENEGMGEKGRHGGRAFRTAQGEQFSKRREFQYCSHKFATLQTRLARLEAYVTSSRFKLNREFRNIS